MSATQLWTEELNAPFPLNAEQCSFYAENGYIKLRQVFSAELLEHYRVHISAKVAELSVNKLPLDQRSTYDKAFLQVGNLAEERRGPRVCLRQAPGANCHGVDGLPRCAPLSRPGSL